MKKYLLLLTITLLLPNGLLACRKEEKTAFPAQIANPMVSFQSLGEVNTFAACSLRMPGNIAVSETSFYGLKTEPKIGGIVFKADGVSYTCRASRTERDISGVYYNGKTLGDSVGKGKDQAPSQYGKGCWARWFSDGIQYSLYAEGENLTLDSFKAVYDALKI